MSSRKSFLTKFSELIDEHNAETQALKTKETNVTPSRMRQVRSWLLNNGVLLIAVVLLILTQNIWAGPGFAPQNAVSSSATTINYQGRLADSGGTPINDTVSLSFSIYDAATDGSLIWGPETHSAVSVSDGLFNVGLGSQTAGGIPTTVWNGDRYLEISVDGEALAPREMIRSVPIAGMALTVPDGSIDTVQLGENAATNSKIITLGPNETSLETSSTEFVNIPGYEITMETSGGPILLLFQAPIGTKNAENGRVHLDFSINGVRTSDSISGITQVVNSHPNRAEQGIVRWVATPPAGTHTFRVQWKTMNPPAFLNRSHYATQFSVIELKR